MTQFERISPPSKGEKVVFQQGKPITPDFPIVPFIRGDGTGVDIWPATQKVIDSAVKTAYGETKEIQWFKIYAGDEACETYGEYQYLPSDTLKAIETYGIAIKGPLTTPVGGGIRSLNVALRQIFDLYSCVRPCRYYSGTPSPHRKPENLDIVVYRENTEDIYMGIEWKSGDANGQKLIEFLNQNLIPKSKELAGKKIPEMCGLGLKPISKDGSQRHIRKAIQHAMKLSGKKKHVTLVHKGNIMKFTEGAFRDWGYELAQEEFRADCITERESWILENLMQNPNISTHENARLIEPGFNSLTDLKQNEIINEINNTLKNIYSSHGENKWRKMVLVDDRIADSIFQQLQTRPEDYSILATMNLNGDYISDAAAAIVGGLGMAPGANIGDKAAIFEATHGTAPKHAGLDRINPGSVILSGVMMLEFMGWDEAANLITEGIAKAIADKNVTYDLSRLMEPTVSPLKCSEFAEAIISNFRK